MQVVSLEKHLNDIEKGLSQALMWPCIGIPFALIKSALGIVQIISALAVAIFASIQALRTNDNNLLKYCWLHIQHGCGNFISGIFEAIPFVGLGMFCYREKKNNPGWYPDSLSLKWYPSIEQEKIKTNEHLAQRHKTNEELENALKEFAIVTAEPSRLSFLNFLLLLEPFYNIKEPERIEKIKNIVLLYLSLNTESKKEALKWIAFELDKGTVPYQLLEFLLEQGFKPHETTAQNEILLINILRNIKHSSWENTISLVTKVVALCNINVMEDGSGVTPLIAAVQNDEIPFEVMAVLIDLGADPNKIISYKVTALTSAKKMTMLPYVIEGKTTKNRKHKFDILKAFDPASSIEQKRAIIPTLLRIGCQKAAEILLNVQGVIPPYLEKQGITYWQNVIFKLPLEAAGNAAKSSLLLNK